MAKICFCYFIVKIRKLSQICELTMSRYVYVLTIVCALLHVISGVLSVCVGVAASVQADIWLAHSVSPIWSGVFVSTCVRILCIYARKMPVCRFFWKSVPVCRFFKKVFKLTFSRTSDLSGIRPNDKHSQERYIGTFRDRHASKRYIAWFYELCW